MDGLTLKVIRHRLSQRQRTPRQTETAFLNILPTLVEAHFNLPTSTSRPLCLCLRVNVCASDLISAHGRRLFVNLCVCVCAHPNPTNSHSGMITERYHMSHTHPWGLRSCGPSHHRGVWSACFAVIVPNIRSRLWDSCYIAFNVTWHHTLKVYPQFRPELKQAAALFWCSLCPIRYKHCLLSLRGLISGLLHRAVCL